MRKRCSACIAVVLSALLLLPIVSGAVELKDFPGLSVSEEELESRDEMQEYKGLLEYVTGDGAAEDGEESGGDEQPGEPQEEEPLIPGDAWEGDYKDFNNKDGSITRVYDNGGVVTTYPDGRKEGVDYRGNLHKEEPDGKRLIHSVEGDRVSINPDGSKDILSSDGDQIRINSDGSHYIKKPTGVIWEYKSKEDDFPSSVSVEGGERLQLWNEDGGFIEGEHTLIGADGSKFTFINISDDDRSEFTMWEEGGGTEAGMSIKSEGENGFIKYRDCGRSELDFSSAAVQNEDGSASSEVKLVLVNHQKGFKRSGLMTESLAKDGSSEFRAEFKDTEEELDFSIAGKFDAEGNPISCNINTTDENGEPTELVYENEVMKYLLSDGSFFKVNVRTGEGELFDAESGDRVKIDEAGELMVARLTADDGTVLHYEDGKCVITDPDGKATTIETDPETGETVARTKDGDIYVVKGDGKIYKNGVEVANESATEEEKTGEENGPSDMEAVGIDAFMGEWVDGEGKRMLLVRNGDNVIMREPDLPWYGGDVCCSEFRAELDEANNTLNLSGISSWVINGSELYVSPEEEKRRLELEAPTLNASFTAVEVTDGVVTKMNSRSESYER